ncbi:hypothetical protein MNBD_GAMMA03-207 [hydrothermal vent metagenome]|uniref:Uncharacterized protein n=1 Tax=hydrothermal vent metagenome TaxID=652676 RepID=A0A3B0WWQ4_9ZZZZ
MNGFDKNIEWLKKFKLSFDVDYLNFLDRNVRWCVRYYFRSKMKNIQSQR